MTSRAFEGPEYMANRGKFAGPSLLEMMEQHHANLLVIGDVEVAQGVADAIEIIRTPYQWLAKHPQTRKQDAKV